ncbi:hypothetical protein LCGC14_0258620 [marine sediment metagenome]|uniref:Uncharacterized protein n=1 Tax=marine sediment metagenome TaxID=412755 RepID=A0A0F9UJ74_9ZZZZ
MTFVNLPAFWFDLFAEDTTVGIFLANQYPEGSDTEVDADTNITLDLISTDAAIVDVANTLVYVNGELAMDGTGIGFQPGWDGPGSTEDLLKVPPVTGSFHDYRITIDPTTGFTSEQTVTVRVVSQTVGGTYTIDESYSFTIEDLVAPQLVSAFATYAKTIRATFNEDMLGSSAEGADDALNPANYAITYVPANDRQAAVSVEVTSVTQISATAYDLTTDIELTFWRAYLLTCGAIADDSSNANALDADFRTAGFESWTPPEWPPTRRFRIWDMLAQQNRDDDVTGDLERLVDCWQDVVWMLLWDADRLEQIWDVDRAQEIFLDARLQDLGNPHSFDLTELQKRKLLDVLVPSYRQHGTEPAIINLVRFFLGITVTVYAYNSFEYRWVLGQDELGQGTILGPGAGTADLYTFVIQSLTDLTTEERRFIGLIADATKPAHEHYLIQDPSDAVTWDHWQLGFSVLGTETILH